MSLSKEYISESDSGEEEVVYVKISLFWLNSGLYTNNYQDINLQKVIIKLKI